jgi:filamentous hemagglutinin family protein
VAHRETLVRPIRKRRALDNALLGSVSLLALMTVSDLGEARSLTPGANVVAPTAAAQQAAIQASQQAAGAAAQAQASLARAAAALAAARKLQSDAATAARAAASSVPNGLAKDGLMPAGGNEKDPLAGIKADPTLWRNADLPTQTTSNSKVTVDINQTQQKSILYWDTFNVGANTTVNFNQAQSDWIALNRVLDPSASPSRILGQINAIGAVYLINRNGIVFGAGSQVNVHTLIASSLDIGKLGADLAQRDNFFMTSGIADLNSFSIYDAVDGKLTKLVAGDITVERGASINANIASDQVPPGGGAVYLFGANVTNSGSITAPTGEVAMVAARTIDLVPGGFSVLPDSVLGKNPSGDLLSLRGTEFQISHFASSYQQTGYGQDTRYLAGTGAVRHDGLIDASQGIVVMNGDKVAIDNPKDSSGGILKDATGNLVQGVISVDTGISRNSMMLLRAATSVTMNGVISSLPVDDGSQPLAAGPSGSGTVPGFTPAYVELSAQSTVTVGASGLISAPSAQVALRAINLGNLPGVYKATGTDTLNGTVWGQRLFNQGADPATAAGGNSDVTTNTPNAPQTVLLAPGAVVDVAGLANVSLPASYNYIAFKPTAEYADMPLQRSPYAAPLYGSTFYIDIRASGTRSDGTKWVGTPLADASGAVSLVGRSIYQLMTVGGSVSLQTDLTTDKGGGSVQTAGSVVNVAGGSVNFEGGMVNSTRLIGADGRIYSMANADPNMTYLGLAGQFTVKHGRWNVTETWSTGTQVYSPGYTEGHDGGSVIVNTVTPVLTGTMYFGSVAGERQINAGQLPLQGSLTLTTPSSVQIGSAPSANYATQSAVTTLSADTLSGYGLSALNVTANDFVVSGGSTLNLAGGGSLSVTTGGAIDIAGTVSAAGGAINLVTDRPTVSKNFTTSLSNPPKDQSGAVIAANVFIEGTLVVSGRFVNDTGRTGTDVSGPAFTDGGSISITTNKDSTSVAGGYRDATGSILLAKGSVLDVSSGGYISPQGKPKTVSTGVMAGKAGSISLAIYNGKKWDDVQGPHTPTKGSATPAVLELDGSLLGYGFESNGSLRLAGADAIRVGGTLQPGETSSIRIGGVPSTLPVSLLTGGGFGSYTIESVADGWSVAKDGSRLTANIIVSAGTNLTLRQQNLASLADYSSTATGTRLGQQGTPLALLPDGQRKPVDLALKADNIVLDTGATIVTDPKANITFAAITNSGDLNLKVTDPLRTVPAQSVELRGSIIDHGGNVFINALKTHLGPKAVVDLSGTFVANSRFGMANGPVISGTYIAGGTFSVEAGAATATSLGGGNYAYTMPGGYLVADAGAKLDVSGSAGFVQVAGAHSATSSLWLWSDAGTVNVDVSQFAWGGSFAATGGRYVGADGTAQADPRANGGTLRLGGGAISLRQDTTDVNAALSAFNQGAGTAPSSLIVAADQLSQFDSVYLYAAAALGGTARLFNDVPGTIYGDAYDGQLAYSSLSITGPLNWTVTNRLEIAAGTVQAPTVVNARLSAPYVLLSGGGGSVVQGSSTLTIKGQTIDVEGVLPKKPTDSDKVPFSGLAFSGFGQVNLISSGDIRLSTPKIVNGIIPTGETTPSDLSTFEGSMISAGDLLLSAQRIYPVSAVNFTIQTPGKVTFAAPAGSSTGIPLSAGGGITVFANTIEQGGNLFAPLGKITLGNTDATVSPIATQSVTLLQHSLTSVTLADTIVPYGATLDDGSWYYNDSLHPLTQPPSKSIVLVGNDVKRLDGSIIDLRGGGDLQAMQWIQGNGGSRDTLTTTPSGKTVYALLPSSDPVAAIDVHFTAASSADVGKTVRAGDTYPLAGTQITLDGGNGIPAGTYTLYPAHYATLPGAMRVVYYGDNTGLNRPTTTLPDGTVLVTGYYTQSTAPGKQSSGQSLFAVQTNSVWQQYSEYSFNRANSYFIDLAAKKSLPVPRLPMDAGRLAVIAQQSILLKGIALTQPGQDDSGNIGRGGELDISAPNLAVIGHAQYVNNETPSGYVGLDVTQLNGFESVLIGGLRSDTGTGTLIDPTTSSVLVDTRGEVFSAPEILLVARAAKPAQLQTIPQTLTVNGQAIAVDVPIYAPAPDSGTVRIAAGSVITTTGIVHAGAGRNYYFAEPTPVAGTRVTAQDIATALGGTLDATGTVISGADVSKLSYFVLKADGNWLTNPDGSIYRHAGSADVNMLQNYSYQTKGLGALFAASNDANLSLSLPSGIAPPSLTVKFQASTDPNVTGAINGGILLPDAGRVHLESGVNITSKVLTLYATATTNSIVVNNGSDVHLQQLNIAARTIGLGSNALLFDKSAALYNRQFADVQALSLKALSGVITVYGDFNPGVASRLTLDAAALVRADNAGSATLSVDGSGSSLTLVNTGAANPSTHTPANNSKLNFDASEIVLGGGSQTMPGYGEVNMIAADRVFVAGPGSLTLGGSSDAVDFNVATQNILVGGATSTGSGSFAVSTGGHILLSDILQRDQPLARPADSAETGGNLSLTGADVLIGSMIQAQAGTITLNATKGDVWLAPRAYLAAGGYKKTLVDVDTYLPGGKVVLKSDKGNVYTDALSVIDVAQPAGGLGYGGAIEVTALGDEATALGGSATLYGILRGAGGPGLGGSFKLDIKGSADLTALADRLLDGGISGAIDIHTRTGNLELLENHTLKAHSVTLTADDATWGSGPKQQFGQIKLRGRIDATGYSGNTLDGTGQAGGQVALYGANSVFLASSGVIDASTLHADERGGDVVIGIGWAAKSKIFLQQGTQIIVSGGTKGGLSGGTVTFRAPLDGNNDVKIAALSNVANPAGTHGTNFYADGENTFDELSVIDATNNINDRSKIGIVGARSVAVNGFIAFDTHASSYGIDGSSLGWFGTIDTAGWYKGVDQNGNLIPATEGTWANITGWTFDTTTVLSGFTGVPATNTSVTDTNGTVVASLTAYVMGLNNFGARSPGNIPFDGTTYNVTFNMGPNQPPPAIAARGTVAGVQSGNFLNIIITDPGSGYTSAPVSATITSPDGSQSWTVSRFSTVTSTLKIVSVQIKLADGFAGSNGTALSPVRIQVGSGQQEFTFKQASNFSGKTVSSPGGQLTFVPDTSNFIPLASSGVFSFDPAQQGKPGIASFVGGAGTGHAFFGDTVSQITQGSWTYNGQSYGFTNLFARLVPLVKSLGADVVHVQPGVELVNSTGATTVTSNWNLAAGTAIDPTTGKAPQYFDPGSSYVNFYYRLATPWGGLDSGALTLRAAENINVNASISDGFFQFGNYLDPNYQASVQTYLGTTGTSRLIDNTAGLYTYYLNNVLSSAAPIAPYKDGANGISPTAQDLVTADLFPHTLRVCTTDCSPANIKTVTAPSSWSYSFTAGADVSSANPTARIPLATAQDRGTADVIVSSQGSYTQNTITGTPLTVNIPTMVRTGTGSIAVAAARDILLAPEPDPTKPDVTPVPGVIYAAGVNTGKLTDPNYSLQTVNGVPQVVVGNSDPLTKQDLFFEPRVLAYGNEAASFKSELYYGPPTAAAFPEKGGDVTVDAQLDVKGYTASGNKVLQYFQPWLLSDTGVTPGANISPWGAGVFAPAATQIASQAAWWIQYGSFQQGFLSAGGNVSILAGHDLIDVSVSLPTTGRVSGGLSADSTPVTHLYGSGNMVVRAGGDILGGSFYEGSGHASIMAGGDIGQNGTVSRFKSSKLPLPDVALLAVDTGQIAMEANGAITIAGVVNPAALHAQQPSTANVLDPKAQTPLYMDTYGPDSKVQLLARKGNLTITIAPPAINDQSATLMIGGTASAAAPALYPASFEALALNGNLITTGIGEITKGDIANLVPGSNVPMPGIVLSPSEHGTFNLLAQGSIDLTFGYQTDTTTLLSGTPRPFISAGPSLIDAAFDPFRPNSGYDDPSSRAILAHANDVAAGLDTTARIYAATGDITATGGYGKRTRSSPISEEVYQHIEIDRPTKVFAGHDLIDLNIIVQNIHTSDVSTIAAGRNISYSGFQNGGGLQVAGPGFLVVQAGGDIGPFLPANHNNSSEAPVQEGIVSVGNSSPTAVGNFYVDNSTGGGSVGIYNRSLLGPQSNPRRNALLTQAAGTTQGADIITMFGTKFGVDYQAVIDAYIDPANAAGAAHNYIAELQAFLSRIGKPASATDAASVFAAFRALPADLQHVFVDQVFFAELKAVGIAQLNGETKAQRGYKMINTMFPSSLGYTANALEGGSGSNGANQVVKTGDLDLLHSTIQTRLGGDISIFGPGGNIFVGSLATEPNSSLKLPDLGILTLGGGAINTFTDQSVRVNASRVLTSQGGEILMWSSNGDLDAGRGSRTISSAPALEVLFDQNDYETVDLGGFVTGSGIQTLRASRFAKAANIYLVAPRGTIDAGTAGIGGSGIVVVIAPVINNAGSIQGQGGTVGIPTVSVPNLGALTAGNNTAAASSKSAEPATAGGNREQASIFIVEVVSYGGGDSSQSVPENSEDKPSDKKKSNNDQ